MKTAIKSQNQRFLWKNIQAKTFKTSEKFAFVLWEIPDFEWGTRYLSTEQQGKKPKAGEVIWATQASALKGLKFKKIPTLAFVFSTASVSRRNAPSKPLQIHHRH